MEPDGDELDASYPEGGATVLEQPREDDEDCGDDEPDLGWSRCGAWGSNDDREMTSPEA